MRFQTRLSCMLIMIWLFYLSNTFKIMSYYTHFKTKMEFNCNTIRKWIWGKGNSIYGSTHWSLVAEMKEKKKAKEGGK